MCFALTAKEHLAATDEDELLAECRELCGEKKLEAPAGASSLQPCLFMHGPDRPQSGNIQNTRSLP